jgi:Tfp pilus assembly protein PilF
MDPETAALLRRAEEYRINGEYEQAQQVYEQVLALYPNLAAAVWGLAHVLMNIGEFDQALEHFAKATTLEPTNQRFAYDYGMMLCMLSKFEEAKAVFERVIELDPSSQIAGRAREQLSYY